jgi:hypothetical protein
MDCDDITELNLDSDLDFNLNSLATFANFFVIFAVKIKTCSSPNIKQNRIVLLFI